MAKKKIPRKTKKEMKQINKQIYDVRMSIRQKYESMTNELHDVVEKIDNFLVAVEQNAED